MTQPSRAAPRWLPSPFALVAAVYIAFFVALVVARGLVDADYFWHVTTGRLIAESGSVPSTDPFSFTWAGQPWVLHEWLGQLFIHLLVSSGGAVPAGVVFGVIIGAAPLVVGLALRAEGVRVASIAALLALAAYVFAPFATVRPQAISWLLVALLIGLLMRLRSEHRLRPWLVVPLFALWANVHGLYVVGLGVLGLYALFSLLGRTVMAPRRWTVIGMVAAAFAASALTPAGIEGLVYPLRYLDGSDWGIRNIQEWQSPDFHDPRHWGLLLLIAGLALNGGRATPGWLTTLSLVGIVMALVATRNAPLAALFALPTLALGLDDRLLRWDRPERPRTDAGRRVLETGVTAILVAAVLVIMPGAVSADAALRRGFPVEGAGALERVLPDARVLADYDWGGYAIYRHYEDGGRVFVDGRSDMYGDAILQDYSTIRAADDGWAELTERYGVEAILLPPSAPLVRGAAQEAGWCEAHRDEISVLLLRESCPREASASIGP